jgi:hypothetical protein
LREDVIVPEDKVAAIFTAVIEEARRRTRQHIALPENESFAVEYVKNKPWNAYNWYRGNGHSVIQLNTDLPRNERLAFERDVLCPLAGLDAAKVASYGAVMTFVRQLGAAQNEAGRRYLNGKFTAEETAAFLRTYALMSLESARKRVAFMDRYRSYFATLVVGYDMVKKYIEKKGGTQDQTGKRWDEYAALISLPRVPSEMK